MDHDFCRGKALKEFTANVGPHGKGEIYVKTALFTDFRIRFTE